MIIAVLSPTLIRLLSGGQSFMPRVSPKTCIHLSTFESTVGFYSFAAGNSSPTRLNQKSMYVGGRCFSCHIHTGTVPIGYRWGESALLTPPSDWLGGGLDRELLLRYNACRNSRQGVLAGIRRGRAVSRGRGGGKTPPPTYVRSKEDRACILL